AISRKTCASSTPSRCAFQPPIVAVMRAFSRVTSWARLGSFQRSGEDACSLSSAARFSRPARSKVPPELGDAAFEHPHLLAQLREHGRGGGYPRLLHGPGTVAAAFRHCE